MVNVDEESSLDDLFPEAEAPAPIPKVPPKTKEPPKTGKTILVVDDSDLMRLAVTTIVAKTGHHAIEAADGNEALDICEHNSPDLIFLDWVMPGKDGLETLKQLRAIPEMASTPVVLLTQVRDKESIREAGVYNVQDYISKPARPDRVRAKILKYFG